MSLTTLEMEIVRGLRLQLNNRKITRKWLQERSTSEDVVKGNIREDEQLVELKEAGLHVWCALKDPRKVPQ
mgnify:CR=1 FL=1